MDDVALFSDPRWETFGLLREAYLALSNRIDADVAADGGLEPAMADLVFRLARAPGRALRAVDIARALSTSTSRTSRLIDEGERRGLLTREPHACDRRALTVTLTESGLASARTAGRVALDSAERHLHSRLSREQTRALETVLRVLRGPDPSEGPGQDLASPRSARAEHHGKGQQCQCAKAVTDRGQ